MAEYIEKPKMVTAVQFSLAKASEFSAVPFEEHYKNEDSKRLCEKCGQALSLHGVIERGVDESRNRMFGTICPSTYIVTEDGAISYRTEADFLSRYEAVTPKEG